MYARIVRQPATDSLTHALAASGLARLPWGAALRAGGLTVLCTALVVTLVVVTSWAGQTEFPGHVHPWGADDHVHGLYEVFGAWAAPLAAVALPRLPEPVVRVLVPVLVLVRAAAGRAPMSRAPPRRLPAPTGV